jgi:cellulose synthase/poly-beta-1,6-N-acetylglucosamine synthase-like glycosyltransferase
MLLTIFYALCGLLFIGYFFLITYYKIGWTSIQQKKDVENHQSTLVSIIVPARNEEDNISNLIHSIQNQTYPKSCFELIIIDDCSTDQTANIVKKYSDSNIKLIALSDYLDEKNINAYKKKAIEIGIKASSGTLIITTDADCTMGENWLQEIVNCFEINQPKMIVMPVQINYSNRFIEIFQSLDFMCLQGITGASVQKKFHGMCNGANLAYTKAAFEEVGGFSGIDHIASGDDLLLMHKIAKKYANEILYLKSAAVIVKTIPAKTIKAFFNQRIRWASKAEKYEDKRMLPVLMLVYLFNLSLFIMMILLLKQDKTTIKLFLFIIFLKTEIELLFLYPVAKFFGERKLLWLFPIFQPFHIVYTICAGFLGKFGTYKWKGRTVK